MAGGYYNGISTMFLPLNGELGGGANNQTLEWEWLGSLPEERKWGAALGIIDGTLTIAGIFGIFN